MNKFAKRLMTGVLAGALATSMALPAFAANLDEKITVSGITDGDTAAVYQVIQRNATTGQWELAEGFTSLTLANLLDGTINADDAAAIVSAAKKAQSKGSLTNGVYTTDTNDKAGLYYVLITPGDSNKTTLYNPVFVSSDYNAGGNTIDITTATGTYNNAGVKKQTPTVEKTVVDTTQQDVAKGDMVAFKVATTIPALSTYTKPVFEISDAVTNNLDIDVDSIKIKIGAGNAESATDSAEQYTLTKSTTGYTFAFKEEYLKTLTDKVAIEITYNATVNNAATYDVNEMTNTASIKFSNNPTDETGKGTDDDKTYHYTFSLDADLLGNTNQYAEELVKIAVDKDGNPITSYNHDFKGTIKARLEGASFKLTSTTDSTKTYTANTDENGHLSFKGLDAGSYTLVETAAPAGFLLNDTEVSVVITPEYNTDGTLKTYTVKVGDSTSTFTMENQGTDEVKSTGTAVATELKNTQAEGLPTTGGMGTTIFYIAGIVLVGGAAILLVTRRRMSAR